MNQRVVKIGRNILFLLSIPAIVGAFAFAKVATKDEICNDIIITFSNNHLSFVTKKNIGEILEKKGVEAHQTKLRSLNIGDLEKSIEENKWVKNSNIFVGAENSIHIKIDQRLPIVRVQPTNDYEDPYYLDNYGNRIPVSMQYTADLPVVTAPEIGFTAPDLALKSDLVTLALYIKNDTFWNAAITQINVNEQRSISLIPAFGTQEIILGNVENLDNKMSRLFQFYKQGFQTVNWDKYDEIDLRFEKQVVCRNTRGQKIAVDPYNKSTHKTSVALGIAAKPVDAPIAVPVAPRVPTAQPVIAKPALVAAKPTAMVKKPIASIQKPKVEVEKSTTIVSKEMPVLAASVPKPVEKKEAPAKESCPKPVVKKTSKEPNTKKVESTEQKTKATEVTESKYFK